jgi:hypothetical protein
MGNFGELVGTVQRNCHISDAQHASDHTLCVFLLKMRELYRWEHDIPFSRPLPKDDVSHWLANRERLWQDLDACAFESLPLAGGAADPFESEIINRELLPLGYVYSGGYGRHNKPNFFLGRLERVERHDDCRVIVSSCEYARDLDAPPAMLQGRTIYVRLESLRRFLWEKIEEANWSHSREAMDHALAGYGMDRGVDGALDRMTEAESRSMILHELGELRVGDLLGEKWNGMLLALSPSRAEIQARALRDILADNLSTLPALIAEGNWPSLHFFFANFSGMRRHLFPRLREAYERATADRSFAPLSRCLETETPRLLDAARAMLALHESGREGIDCAVENMLVSANA